MLCGNGFYFLSDIESTKSKCFRPCKIHMYIILYKPVLRSCHCCSHINSHNLVRVQADRLRHTAVEKYPRKNIRTQTKPNLIHAYIIADAVHASARKIQKVKSGVSLRRARSISLHTSHHSRVEKTTTPLATQTRRPRTCYTWYLSLRIRTSNSSQLEKDKRK